MWMCMTACFAVLSSLKNAFWAENQIKPNIHLSDRRHRHIEGHCSYKTSCHLLSFTEKKKTSAWQLFCLELHKVVTSSRHLGREGVGNTQSAGDDVWLRLPRVAFGRGSNSAEALVVLVVIPRITLLFIVFWVLDKLAQLKVIFFSPALVFKRLSESLSAR